MKLNRLVMVSLVVAALSLFASATARADQWDRKTIVTFREPFRVPGRSLPSGNYVFKIADAETIPHLVQIFDAHERHLVATLLAVPDYLTKPAEHAEFLLDPRSERGPEALRAWWFPGDTVAEAFVYPHSSTEQIARVQ